VRTAGDANAVITLDLAEGVLNYTRGNFRPALEMTEAVSRQRSRLKDPAREVMASGLHAEVLLALDRPDEAVRLSASGLAVARRDHQGWAVRLWEGQRGRQLLQAGRLADAIGTLEAIVDALEDLPSLAVLDAAVVAALGRAAIHTGNKPLIHKCSAVARELVSAGTPAVQRHGMWLLSMVAMWDGDIVAARAQLGALGDDERLSIVPLFPVDVTDEMPLVRVALAAGDAELSNSLLATARERLALNPGVASIAGCATHMEGLVTGDLSHLLTAVKELEAAPRPLALASALEDAGSALARLGDQPEGTALLGRALHLFTTAGASWDAGRVRRRLRALGVRWRLSTASPPRQGWSGLTKSELDVVRLVSQGLTNRQTAERLFLSRHTVSNHLRHAFTKLDITSRVELARLAAVHDSLPR
jgi:DNA-binding CsgD family transcriptional regulator